ncbi:hypothetical protein QIS99_16400 [Streptomyces sp. B-S-A8]|uniref:DUF3311 domain-containing protein n=1 Tax=Streptomyces solicavernae TaxID=3043614 RepID=A0ABT6RTL2_9ACTN|nr:hypothetical protein [Streptomyces sp. B-S-A8]MDI3387769.1 hypothetical protein [Streptomyces sp. B-S-A8]
MSQRHLAYLAVPAAGFLATPYLPFVNSTHLWFGLPSVLVWCVLWTVGTTAALALYEAHAPHPEDTDEEAAK